jgi:hypothetical protein
MRIAKKKNLCQLRPKIAWIDASSRNYRLGLPRIADFCETDQTVL